MIRGTPATLLRFSAQRVTRSISALTILVILLLVPVLAYAQSNDVWLGGTGNWSDASKWSAGVPTAGSSVFIDDANGVASVVTVDVAMQTGLARTANMALKFGLPRPMPYPALALGTTVGAGVANATTTYLLTVDGCSSSCQFEPNVCGNGVIDSTGPVAEDCVKLGIPVMAFWGLAGPAPPPGGSRRTGGRAG